MRHFRSIYISKKLSYFLCYLWEKHSELSKGQFPPVYNRRKWSANWKGNKYSYEKLKKLLGWKPRIPFVEASKCYFEYCKNMEEVHA